MALGRSKEQKAADDNAETLWRGILEASGEGAGSVAVWRKETGKERDYLGLATVEEMSHDAPEVLRARWGGGKYVIQLKDDAGKYLAGTRAHFSIAGAPKDPNDEKAAELERVTKELEELRGGGARDQNTALIMVELIRQQSELMRELHKPKAGPDMAAIITAVGTVAAPVLTAILELIRDRKGDDNGAMNRLEELQTLMELAKGMGGGPQDGLGMLAQTLGKPIAQLVDAHVGGNGGAAGALPSGARPNPPTGGDTVARPPWYNFVRPVIDQALRWAAAGKDPAFRAEFVVDELTDEQLEPVRDILTSEGFPALFYEHFPQARPHAEWFDVFFSEMVDNIVPVAELEAGDDVAEEPQGETDAEAAVTVGTREPAPRETEEQPT